MSGAVRILNGCISLRRLTYGRLKVAAICDGCCPKFGYLLGLVKKMADKIN